MGVGGVFIVLCLDVSLVSLCRCEGNFTSASLVFLFVFHPLKWHQVARGPGAGEFPSSALG